MGFPSTSRRSIAFFVVRHAGSTRRFPGKAHETRFREGWLAPRTRSIVRTRPQAYRKWRGGILSDDAGRAGRTHLHHRTVEKR